MNPWDQTGGGRGRGAEGDRDGWVGKKGGIKQREQNEDESAGWRGRIS